MRHERGSGTEVWHDTRMRFFGVHTSRVSRTSSLVRVAVISPHQKQNENPQTNKNPHCPAPITIGIQKQGAANQPQTKGTSMSKSAGFCNRSMLLLLSPANALLMMLILSTQMYVPQPALKQMSGQKQNFGSRNPPPK